MSRSSSCICVYSDRQNIPRGASYRCIYQTLCALRSTYPQHDIYTISPRQVATKNWMSRTRLLVMPGGASLPYEQWLKGPGNDNIRHFIQEGGSFLGICAGAYYACSHVDFQPFGPWSVKCHHTLQLFPHTTAYGPALGHYSPYHQHDARLAWVTLSSGQQACAFYYGGPSFSKNEGKIIATFWTPGSSLHNAPAAIYKKYGKGHVVLSALHGEYWPENMLGTSYQQTHATRRMMHAHRLKIAAYWNAVTQYFCF